MQATESRSPASEPAEILAERHRLLGDDQTYDDLENANLISVIDRRRGLPVALSILYIHAARRQGWPVEGSNFPGHFLIRLAAATAAASSIPSRAASCAMPPICASC